MNSAMRPSFKVRFAEIRTCRSYEQCTGSTEKKTQMHWKRANTLSKLTLRPILQFILVYLQVIIVILGAIEYIGFVIGCVAIFCLSKGFFFLILGGNGQRRWAKIFFIGYHGLICKHFFCGGGGARINILCKPLFVSWEFLIQFFFSSQFSPE